MNLCPICEKGEVAQKFKESGYYFYSYCDYCECEFVTAEQMKKNVAYHKFILYGLLE